MLVEKVAVGPCIKFIYILQIVGFTSFPRLREGAVGDKHRLLELLYANRKIFPSQLKKKSKKECKSGSRKLFPIKGQAVNILGFAGHMS